MTGLNDRGVIAGKLHVSVVIFAFHLIAVQVELPQLCGIRTGAQPVFNRTEVLAVLIVQAWRGCPDGFHLFQKVGPLTGTRDC